MSSIALIGPDGAGKTTLSRMLEQSELLPIRYLYMGVAASSSNVALPTTRLAEWVKQRTRKTMMADRHDGALPSAVGSGGRLRAAVRLANRLVEEWYRQFVSWYYQIRGFVVLYDRHFLFDFAPEIVNAERESLEQRIHRWALTYLYPRPDLVIFLDAPGEVLFARKGELSVVELERRRQGFLLQGKRIANFVRVDATKPLADVYDELVGHIARAARKDSADIATAVR
jgi:thymidylate kinase